MLHVTSTVICYSILFGAGVVFFCSFFAAIPTSCKKSFSGCVYIDPPSTSKALCSGVKVLTRNKSRPFLSGVGSVEN